MNLCLFLKKMLSQTIKECHLEKRRILTEYENFFDAENGPLWDYYDSIRSKFFHMIIIEMLEFENPTDSEKETIPKYREISRNEEMCLVKFREQFFNGQKSKIEIHLENELDQTSKICQRIEKEYYLRQKIRENYDKKDIKMNKFKNEVICKILTFMNICSIERKLSRFVEISEILAENSLEFDSLSLEKDKQKLIEAIDRQKEFFEEHVKNLTIIRTEMFNNEKPEWELEQEFESF